LIALLAAADSGNEEFLCELLKHSACVVIAFEKYSELLKAAAVKSHVDVVCELLKMGGSAEVSKKRC
jgi:hypothetical protein